MDDPSTMGPQMSRLRTLSHLFYRFDLQSIPKRTSFTSMNATQSDITLRFMGEGEPETFRCRVYVSPSSDHDAKDAFVNTLRREGVLDCPAYDEWIAVLREHGWVESKFELLDNGDRVLRWTLTGRGVAAEMNSSSNRDGRWSDDGPFVWDEARSEVRRES